MRFALGAKFGNPGSPPWEFFPASAWDVPGSKPPRAAAPMPRAVREKKWRRVMANGSIKPERVFINSSFPNGGVEIHDGLGQRGHRSELDDIQRRIMLLLAHFDQLPGPVGLLGE